MRPPSLALNMLLKISITAALIMLVKTVNTAVIKEHSVGGSLKEKCSGTNSEHLCSFCWFVTSLLHALFSLWQMGTNKLSCTHAVSNAENQLHHIKKPFWDAQDFLMVELFYNNVLLAAILIHCMFQRHSNLFFLNLRQFVVGLNCSVIFMAMCPLAAFCGCYGIREEQHTPSVFCFFFCLPPTPRYK